jgi:hypothetical protein
MNMELYVHKHDSFIYQGFFMAGGTYNLRSQRITHTFSSGFSWLEIMDIKVIKHDSSIFQGFFMT